MAREDYEYDYDCVFSSNSFKDMLMESIVKRLQGYPINKCQILKIYLSFLLQSLHHKTHPLVKNLEKDHSFLLTILGDICWMLGDTTDQPQFQDLMAEFEAVANQAGSFLHSFFLSTDKVCEEIEDGLAAVLNHNGLLIAKLELSHITIPSDSTPKTSIVNSFIFLDSLAAHLEDLSKWEDDRAVLVKDQINLLHQGVPHLCSSINDIRTPHTSEIEELKEPLMRTGDIAHQVEYLITTAFLAGDAHLCYVINMLTELIHKIHLVTTELQVITETYNFGALKGTKHQTPQSKLQNERKNDFMNEVTVGLDDKTIDILDQLVGEGTMSLQVISIFGMPGLGKTTLAKKLYNHALVRDRFYKLSCCIISQTYERRSILADILIQMNSELGKDKILNMEEKVLVEHIHKTLKRRRYFIVMDDIWDMEVWDELQRCFPEDGNGSRILLTSRNKDVAPRNSIIHKLAFLSNEQCWELLQKKAFRIRTCPPQMRTVGTKIAAKCRGLPLTVIVIAGFLSTVAEEEGAWEEVGGSLASYIENDLLRDLWLKKCKEIRFMCHTAMEKCQHIRVFGKLTTWSVFQHVCSFYDDIIESPAFQLHFKKL